MLSRDSKQIWSIPNIISMVRLLLIPLIVGLYFKKKVAAALFVFALSALSDIVDGQIARRCHMITDLGKMLDPLADKLTQAAALVCVAFTHPQLFYLLGLMVCKELAQAAVGYHSVRRTGQVYSAMWYGKACTVILTASLMALFAFPQLPEPWVNALLSLCAVAMALSLLLYVLRYHRLNQAARRETVS